MSTLRTNTLQTLDSLHTVAIADLAASSTLKVDLDNAVDPLKGAALVGYKNRDVYQRLKDFTSVKDFGAVGDGVADDTTAVQNAVNAINAQGGGKLYFPKGIYLCGKITVYSNLWIVGEGRDNSVIKLKNGANTDLIYGDQSDSRWLTTSTAGVSNLGLFDITLDGNRANNTAGNCLANYGDDLYLQNVFITGAADNGIRSDFYDTNNSYGMEGHFINVKIDSCGKHGWLFDGPHDSVFFNVTVIDAGQASDNTYDGIQVGSRANGRFIGCHVWNRSAAFRHRYAVNLMPGGGGNEFTACHLEGAQSANVRIGCSNNMFDPSTRIYFPWGGINILMNSTATLNTIRCRISGPFPGSPDSYGIVLGSVTGDTVNDNFIDCTSVENRLGSVWFNFSDGGNQVRVRGYAVSGSAIGGTPGATDRVDVFIRGLPSTTVNNITQATSLSMTAGAGTTWTFPYSFGSAPKVTYAPRSPSGALDGHLWITAIGANSVTIFNNSTRTLTLDVVAERL